MTMYLRVVQMITQSSYGNWVIRNLIKVLSFHPISIRLHSWVTSLEFSILLHH